MSEDGKNLMAVLQSLRRFCEQVSLLLGTADGLIGEEGWKSETSTLFAGTSYILSWPRFWIPQYFVRFYKRDDLRHIMAFVAVLLDDAENKTNLEEPLLTAGWFDYGHGKEVKKQWDYHYARWHLKMPGRRDDGELQSEDSTTWPNESLPFVRVATLGLPLTSVVDTESLKNKVINPLIREMKRAEHT